MKNDWILNFLKEKIGKGKTFKTQKDMANFLQISETQEEFQKSLHILKSKEFLMNKIINKEAILSEIAGTRELLNLIPDFDTIGRITYTALIKKLEKELEEYKIQDNPAGEVILYLEGDPVKGSDSIFATFSSTVLGIYQNLLSLLYANRKNNTIANTGAIALNTETKEFYKGTFRGALINSKKFDFITEDNILIKGSIHKSLNENYISDMNIHYTSKLCNATFTKIETTNDNKNTKIKWILESLESL